MKIAIILLFTFLISFVQAQWPAHYTPTYEELIQFYSDLAAKNEAVEIYCMGMSDVGKPIHLVILNGAQDSIATFVKARQETTVLINNGIHPGEPDGINACASLIQEYTKSKKKAEALPLIAIIPVYNIGGMMNRGSTSRANQNGPAAYGFRGNAENLDLNRDFIKMDSENAQTFVKIFHALNPDVFIDTHVSNGADYQYTLTLIHSLQQRQSKSMQQLMSANYFPALAEFSKKTGWDWAPYVETKAMIPDSGIVAFNDLPRYAQGYASLFNTVSITLETHMLKPFDQRVKASYDYLDFIIKWAKANSGQIEKVRNLAIQESLEKKFFPHHFELTSPCDSILFKGYTAEFPISELTGLARLKYNRSKPFTKMIPYYNGSKFLDSSEIPQYYVVSHTCKEIIERLLMNQVELKTIYTDTTMVVNSIRVVDFNSPKRPYEGHFLHDQIKTIEQTDTINLFSGSILVPTNQPNRNFIISVLEPELEDSYFAWNFMDSYVQQKEYFSAYVFEDLALEILKNDARLKKDFEAKKSSEPDFRNSASQQLYYIYSKSPYFEKSTFMRLPIFKIY